jgi:hypothetical protein
VCTASTTRRSTSGPSWLTAGRPFPISPAVAPGVDRSALVPVIGGGGSSPRRSRSAAPR